MACSRMWRESWISGVMSVLAGNGGRAGSMVVAEEGEDSASKRAWRTAESLVVKAAAMVRADYLIALGQVAAMQQISKEYRYGILGFLIDISIAIDAVIAGCFEIPVSSR